jgi:hypothetical protein
LSSIHQSQKQTDHPHHAADKSVTAAAAVADGSHQQHRHLQHSGKFASVDRQIYDVVQNSDRPDGTLAPQVSSGTFTRSQRQSHCSERQPSDAKFITAEIHREFEQETRPVSRLTADANRRGGGASGVGVILPSPVDDAGRSMHRAATGRVSPRLAAVAASEWRYGEQQPQWSSLEQTRLGVRGRSPITGGGSGASSGGGAGGGERGRGELSEVDMDCRTTRRVRSCEERRLLERQREIDRVQRFQYHLQWQQMQQPKRRMPKKNDPLRITEFSVCGNDDDADDDHVSNDNVDVEFNNLLRSTAASELR